MRLDSQIPSYYATAEQSGFSKRRVQSNGYEMLEDIVFYRVRPTIANVMRIFNVIFLYIPEEAFPRVWLRLLVYLEAFRMVYNLDFATHVVVRYRGEPRSSPIILSYIDGIPYFDHEHIRYFHNSETDSFVRSAPVQFAKSPPLSSADVVHRQDKFGDSSYASHIYASRTRAFAHIIAEKIFMSPLIYFECFCVSMWTVTKYTTYAVVIVGLVLIERMLAIHQSYLTWLHLHAISSAADEEEVTVVRIDDDGREAKLFVPAKNLVPGDHVLIVPDMQVPCDCVLIKGEVIADISIVTGESQAHRFIAVPPGRNMRTTSVSASLLLCGSRVLRTRVAGGVIECRAIVVATAFHTRQGSFLISVLFRDPSPAEKRMKAYLIHSVCVLVALGVSSMIYTYFVSTVWLNLHPTEIFVRIFDILTDALPPAFPVALSIATMATAVRLPSYISTARSGRPTHILAGLVSTVVLDKTNTVTCSNMSVTGVIEGCDSLVAQRPRKNSILEVAVAACNYLAVLGTRIVGDPVEVALMESIDWEVDREDDSFVRRSLFSTSVSPSGFLSPALQHIHDADVSALNDLLLSERQAVNSAQILASFPFNPVSRRMSVVSRLSNSDSLVAFSKGAPEAIIRLCDPSSLPFTLEATLDRLCSLGYRLLAYSYKRLDRSVEAHKLDRDACEQDMTFAGIVLLSNDLHPNSRAAIADLQASNIAVILCTGDSAGTAVAVARQAGIYQKPKPGLTQPLLDPFDTPQCVYSRMTPDDKAIFVERLAEMEVHGAVLMCGDGPNDTNALCAADVGVVVNSHPNALLESAAGCMACTDPAVGLRAVVDIITHGRSSLAVLICVAKIVMAYAFIEGVCVTLCYSVGSNLTDAQYLVVDLFIVLPSVLLFAITATPAESISETSPMPRIRLISTGLIFQCSLCIIAQVAALMVLKYQDWYVAFQPGLVTEWEHSTDGLGGSENTLLFLMCCYQCLLLVWNFTARTLDTWCRPIKDHPLLQGWFWLVSMAIGTMVVSVTMDVGKFVRKPLDLVQLHGLFVGQIFIIVASHVTIACLWEWRILPRLEQTIV